MTVTMCEAKRNVGTKSKTVLRVAEGGRYVGDILLDDEGRVWRKAATIPADVVLKALAAWSRGGEACGSLTGRKDGRSYAWYVVGAMPEMDSEPAEAHAA